jgi:hypothetical protein
MPAVEHKRGTRFPQTQPHISYPTPLSHLQLQGDAKHNNKALQEVLQLCASSNAPTQVLLITASISAAAAQLAEAQNLLRPARARLHVLCAEAEPKVERGTLNGVDADGFDDEQHSSAGDSDPEQRKAQHWARLMQASHLTGGLCLSLDAGGSRDVLHPLCSEHLTAPRYLLQMGHLEAPITLFPPPAFVDLNLGAVTTAAADSAGCTTVRLVAFGPRNESDVSGDGLSSVAFPAIAASAALLPAADEASRSVLTLLAK